MTKHTKGPWKVEAMDRYQNYSLNTESDFVSTDEALANARLIAAAPELLAELQQALKLLESIEIETGYCTAVTQREWKRLISKASGAA